MSEHIGYIRANFARYPNISGNTNFARYKNTYRATEIIHISCSMDCYYYVMLSPHCCGNGVCSEVRVWKSNVKFLKRSTGHCAGEVPVVPAKAVEYNDKCNEDVMVESMAA